MAIAFSVDNLTTELQFPGPAGTYHRDWTKIKLRQLMEFGSFAAAGVLGIQLHQFRPLQRGPPGSFFRSLVEF